jgi:predicted oxidoreductase
MTMERKFLHLKGIECSRIIAGAWRWNEVNAQTVEKLIKTSLDLGITTFDHADIYGNYSNESLFGDVLKKEKGLRKKMELVTKCGIKLLSPKFPGTWIKHYDTTKGHIINSVDQSLANLGTDFIDLLLIHRPDPLMDPEDVADAFGLLRQNGKVLHFGVSNFTPTQFEMLQSCLSFPLITNQIEFSLTKYDPIYDGTLDVLMKHKVCPMAWSPLGGGKLMNANQSLWVKKEKYKATETQLALAWLLKHPADVFPVIGTTQPDRIAESAKAMEVVLDRQDWFEMLKAATGSDIA